MICHDGGLWHGRRRRFLRVLNESSAALRRDCLQASSSVATATTQNYAHDLLTVGFGGGNEQGVSGGAGVMDFRPVA
jgi:hypothetical protein